MTALVSVVIPAYRRSELLRQAIRSVLGQTVRALELVVVENGNSHECETVVQEFQATDGRVRYHYDPHPDPCLARNLGVRMTSGPLVAFLDSDDEWLPNKLQRQLDTFDREPYAAVVTCQGWVVDQAGCVLRVEPKYRGPITLEVLVRQGCVLWSLSSVLIRRNALERVGLFNPRFFIANDYDLYLRLARYYRLVRIDAPLFRYLTHADNMSRQNVPMLQEDIEILRMVQPAPALGVTAELLKRRLAYRHYRLASEWWDLGEYCQAANAYWAAIRQDPLVGRSVPWSKMHHPLYQFVKPYAAVAACLIKQSIKPAMAQGRAA